jgi:hypothetical protein
MVNSKIKRVEGEILMAKMKAEQERYLIKIYDAIGDVLESEMEDYDGVEVVDFITAYIKAGAVLLKDVSDIEKNFLEFTYFANHLIVQDMLENKYEMNHVDLLEAEPEKEKI